MLKKDHEKVTVADSLTTRLGTSRQTRSEGSREDHGT